MNEQQKTTNNFYVLVGSNIEPAENIKKGLNLIEQENKIFLIKSIIDINITFFFYTWILKKFYTFCIVVIIRIYYMLASYSI